HSRTTTLADQIKGKSECLSKGFPSVYKVPLQEIHTNLDGCKIYAFGKENIREHRTIMVIGATGAGKSTLINGMINYILDVKWEDNFRFKLIDEGLLKSQAESQTSLVTAYEINYQDGYTINYSITIIDTPGFGDTRGIERDRVTDGISDIDAVCFVTQASLARLTHPQKYVFDSILSIFGKDIADNIQMLVTFADGQKPPVLEAINVSGVPCPRTEKGIPVHFKFNNSALFADNSHSGDTKNSDDENEEDSDDNFDKMFWIMGVKSMKKFFVALTHMETKSLKLTKEVLKERKQLETAVTGLQPQVRAGLAKLDEIKKTQQIIQKHEAEINTNKNFEFEVELMKPDQVSIEGSGAYITNCQQCYVTCHYPCAIPDDKDKAGCAAMDSQGNCNVCSGKCPWNVHFNQKYRWEYKKVTEKRTSEELKAKYEKASGKKMSAEEIIKTQEEEILRLQDEILQLMETSQRCLARLQEIPNPLSTPEYIDLLIESEKAEAKPGFMERIKYLEAMKEQAVIIQKVINKEELLPSEARMYKAKRERQEEQNTFVKVMKGFLGHPTP
uniref:Septin-type G domain-containing protein n=1 Tax=Paramormyrops kingsleyae TaxID=1676925 RepID=A0A3B3SND6_9TELE